jgi:hypothetical protein
VKGISYKCSPALGMGGGSRNQGGRDGGRQTAGFGSISRGRETEGKGD